MVQSAPLTQFYGEYVEWLDNGASEYHPYFLRANGLCASVELFCEQYDYDYPSLDYELNYQFTDAGLHPIFPFNDSSDSYGHERDTDTIHLNPARVAWVRKHAAVQSEELTAFYQAYKHWLDAGAPHEGKFPLLSRISRFLRRDRTPVEPFTRDDGLCRNLGDYRRRHGIRAFLTHEIERQFIAAGRDSEFPFNGSYGSYWRETWEKAAHLNPARILWVDEHAV